MTPEEVELWKALERSNTAVIVASIFVLLASLLVLL